MPNAAEQPLSSAKTLPTDQRPTVLVVHASVGSGHKSAAEAIGAALELLREEGVAPEDLNIEVLDILDFGRIRFDGDKTASMFTGATRPFYDLTWRYTFTGRLLWGGGTIWARIMFPRFVEHVREVRPCAIVCTHITAANVAVSARMITDQDFAIVCVPTDYEVEGLWPHLYTDAFCVADEHMAETLRPRKVPEERIRITGIPANPSFRRSYDRATTRERFGLPQDKQVVLALAGATLPRPYVHFREAIDALLPSLRAFDHLHMVIVAGKDADYADAVRRKVDDLGLTNVTVLGFVEEMAALMAGSDLVVCKSGGLVVTECLCAQVPMILMGRAYGQEKSNVLMLTGSGAAMHATTTRELISTLRHIDRHPEAIKAMLVNASFLRRPDAALDVARMALDIGCCGESASGSVPDAAKPRAPRKKHFVHFYFGGKPAHTR